MIDEKIYKLQATKCAQIKNQIVYFFFFYWPAPILKYSHTSKRTILIYTAPGIDSRHLRSNTTICEVYILAMTVLTFIKRHAILKHSCCFF